jgi:hypothetical protein
MFVDGVATAFAITRDHDILTCAGPALYCMPDGKLRWEVLGDSDKGYAAECHSGPLGRAGCTRLGGRLSTYRGGSPAQDLCAARLGEDLPGRGFRAHHLRQHGVEFGVGAKGGEPWILCHWKRGRKAFY